MADATQVYIFQQMEREPIYHLPAWLARVTVWRETEDGGEKSLVACGRAYWTWKPGGKGTEHAIRLRRDHASLFSRLCIRCQRVEQRNLRASTKH